MSMSGPRVRKFTEGWAVGLATGWRLAHFFRRMQGGRVVPLCRSGRGLRFHAGRMLEPGSFPHCKKCDAALAREARVAVRDGAA